MTWLDIGRLPDFYRVSQLALLGQVPGYFPPGREIAPGLRTGINVSINPKRCRLEVRSWLQVVPEWRTAQP
jgi:hypothetical protein